MRSPNRVTDPVDHGDAETDARFGELVHQHPLIAHLQRTGDLQPHRISDFLTYRDLSALELYQDVFRPQGIRHQTAVSLGGPGFPVIGLVFSRGAELDFSERDLEIIDTLRPHVAAIRRLIEMRAVAEAAARAVDADERAVVVAGVGGRVVWRSATAADVLARWFDPGSVELLPPRLLSWLGDPPAAAAAPLVLHHGGDALRITLLDDGTPGTISLWLEEDRSGSTDLHLTNRERDVLVLVARGRSNRQIADELVISERTVRKHLEHLYAKLGVHSRTEAAAVAHEMGWINGGGR